MRNVLLVLLISVRVFAETIPAAAPAPAPPPPEWEGSAEASALLTSGNSKNTTLGLGGRLQYQPEPWSAKLALNYLISSNAGVKSAESFDGLLRAERKVDDSLSGFTQTTYLKNLFAGFIDRIGGEVGASYALLQSTGGHKLTTELGAGVLHENRTDVTLQTVPTARLGLNYAWKISETAEFGATLALLENLDRTRDWRLANTYSLTTVLTRLFSLKVGFRIDHLNVPVPGKLPTDTTTNVSLVAKF